MFLTDKELYEVRGGATLTASMLDGISKLFTTFFEIGKSVGSSIRRIYSKNYC